jgi:hypothetical protein
MEETRRTDERGAEDRHSWVETRGWQGRKQVEERQRTFGGEQWTDEKPVTGQTGERWRTIGVILNDICMKCTLRMSGCW